MGIYLNDKEIYSALRFNARKKAETSSIESTIETLEKLYR